MLNCVRHDHLFRRTQFRRWLAGCALCAGLHYSAYACITCTLLSFLYYVWYSLSPRGVVFFKFSTSLPHAYVPASFFRLLQCKCAHKKQKHSVAHKQHRRSITSFDLPQWNAERTVGSFQVVANKLRRATAPASQRGSCAMIHTRQTSEHDSTNDV